MARGRKNTTVQPVPPDQDQRDLVQTVLHRNMLVEAAAGTGKTTCLLNRMLALLKTGTCPQVRNLAAVTFTRKAAAELRARFQVRLETEVHACKGKEKESLERALANMEQCFIGTIHSFCARLLRERPVEARVDLAFEEIEEETDGRLRKEAWDALTARLIAHDPKGILTRLDRLGLRLADLEGTWGRFAEYPDVDEWPVPAETDGIEGLEAGITELSRYLDHMARLFPRLPKEWGRDNLIPEYRRLPRIASHYEDLSYPPHFMEVLGFFDKTGRVVQKEWMRDDNFTRDEARKEQDRWNRFRDETAAPLLRTWRESRYAPVMGVMFQAREVYDRLRRDRGWLNFQDLLLKAADLLRDKPHVRRYFQDRFRFLLVDEFQDTDPVQAEVMLLLTASNPEETEWRQCRPRPGSLFVVGDPKQSIYRFRRADIVTYNEVKEIIGRGEEEGEEGLVVRLSANFRTNRNLIHWVNEVFSPHQTDEDLEAGAGAKGDKEAGDGSAPLLRFPSCESHESPSYVALDEGRVDGNVGDWNGLYLLAVPEGASNREDALEVESEIIARTIRKALDTKMTVTRTRREMEAGRSETVDPSDFMIIARNRPNLSVYARKLQVYGIPHQVTGGSALNEVSELALLHTCLTAVIRPDDPVALVAALRSELFGISDAALYSFMKADGRFSYHAPIPVDLPVREEGPLRDFFQDAFDRLKTYNRWLSRFPPITALERIIADLGLMVLAGSRPGGDVEAGSLAKAMEILRSVQHETWTTAQLLEILGGLVQKSERYDGISARSEEQARVRIMNLHKVKGLEAPVVFLADPSGEFHHPVDRFIDRSVGRTLGFMAVLGVKRGNRQPEVFAHPSDWDELAEKEKRFLRAEALRLRYVAATRAGSAMIVTQRKGNKRNNTYNPWKYFEGYLPEDRVLQDPGPQVAPAGEEVRISSNEVREARQRIAGRIARAREKTYNVRRAKDFALASAPVGIPPRTEETPDEEPVSGQESQEQGEHGVEWGTVIHRLLELAMKNPSADLHGFARSFLAEQELEPDLAGSAVDLVRMVTHSPLWKRAQRSLRRLTEVPFEVMRQEAGSVPTILRGVMDLVFLEDDGWVLVDYKTDSLQGTNPDKLAEKYAPQIELYRNAWEECTRETVKAAALFFVREDELVWIS